MSFFFSTCCHYVCKVKTTVFRVSVDCPPGVLRLKSGKRQGGRMREQEIRVCRLKNTSAQIMKTIILPKRNFGSIFSSIDTEKIGRVFFTQSDQ